MDIDKIKWMVDYAGWEWIIPFKNEAVSMTIPSIQIDQYDILVFITDDFDKSVWFHMLLQRAIEGINRQEGEYEIIQNGWCVSVEWKSCVDEYSLLDNPEKAKESVLNYVYEKEKINENKK